MHIRLPVQRVSVPVPSADAPIIIQGKWPREGINRFQRNMQAQILYHVPTVTKSPSS